MGLIPNGGEDGYELSCAQEHNKHNSTSLYVLKIPVIENLRSLLDYATDHPLMDITDHSAPIPCKTNHTKLLLCRKANESTFVQNISLCFKTFSHNKHRSKSEIFFQIQNISSFSSIDTVQC